MKNADACSADRPASRTHLEIIAPGLRRTRDKRAAPKRLCYAPGCATPRSTGQAAALCPALKRLGRTVPERRHAACSRYSVLRTSFAATAAPLCRSHARPTVQLTPRTLGLTKGKANGQGAWRYAKSRKSGNAIRFRFLSGSGPLAFARANDRGIVSSPGSRTSRSRTGPTVVVHAGGAPPARDARSSTRAAATDISRSSTSTGCSTHSHSTFARRASATYCRAVSKSPIRIACTRSRTFM